MRLNVKVIPRSSKNEIAEMPDGTLKIKITAPPVEGAANERIIELLADKFNVAKSCISILKGQKGKNKVVEIL
jgi:hypothetical protein